jgi:hypothetical protein
LLFPDGARRNGWLDWLSPVVDLTPGLPGYFSAPRTLHWDALLWVTATAASVGAATWLAARLRLRDTTRATVYVVAVCAGAVVAIGVTWARSSASPVSPTASQLTFLAHVRDRGVSRVLDVRRAAWMGADDALTRLEIGSDRRPPGAEDSSLRVAGVPPGRFLLQTPSGGRAGQRLSIWIGRSAAALDVWAREGAGVPGLWEVTLPAGARVLAVRPGPAGHAPAPRVTLRPIAMLPPPANAVDPAEVAIRGARYGDVFVFSFEDNVWLEDAGVWIGGGRTARLALGAPAGRSSVAVTVRAGPPGARVTLDGPGLAVTRVLGAHESMPVDLPVDARTRTSWITVRTDRAFRPADYETGSLDRRLLGCSLSFR